MTLGELLAAVPPATYVFITVEYASAARAEGTIYGPRERLNIPPRIEAALVTRLYYRIPQQQEARRPRRRMGHYIERKPGIFRPPLFRRKN